MSSENTLSLVCKKCGKSLEIPAELTEFSCIYCGEKMSVSDFAYDGNIDDLTERIAFCLTENRDLMGSFSKGSYTAAFTIYSAKCRPTFERLNANILTNPAQKSAILKRTAEMFVEDVQAFWQADPRWNSRLKRGVMMEDDKLIIAIFMVPMIVELGLPTSMDIAEAIQAEWVRVFPKSPFYIGSFKDINQGFKKKFLGLCFLTTAVCEFENKPDDCRELTVLRSFRDGWLAAQPDGPALIDEYYEKAPVIVTLIDLTTDRRKAYGRIRDEYITPCVEDAEAGRMEQCKSRYIRMMRELEERYLPRS